LAFAGVEVEADADAAVVGAAAAAAEEEVAEAAALGVVADGSRASRTLIQHSWFFVISVKHI
jgi:hypothetical protein